MVVALDPIVIDEEPNTVSIDTTAPPAPETVNLPVAGVNTQPPAPDVAKQRTSKTQQGLGDVIKRSTQGIYQDFLDGKEEQIRTSAATALDYKKAMQRQQAIQDLAQKQGPLQPEQVMQIMDPFAPHNTPTDPATVIERAYATNYVSSLNTAAGYMSDTNPLTVAQKEMPQQADEALLDGSELLTKNQYILKRLQDLQEGDYKNQSWLGWGADQVKQFFQPYTEYKERGLLEGTSKLAGLGLGSNIDEQHYNLYRMPLGEFRQKFDAAFDYLAKNNPSQALDYASKMLSQNTFEATTGNVFSAMAVPDALAAGKVGAKIVKLAVTRNQVRKAANDIVQSAARDPNATPATMAEGAGVVGEAAVKRTASEVTAAINGNSNPLEVVHNTLMTTWWDDAKKFAANPGTYLSREAYTRIHDGFAKAGEDLLNRITLMARVERQPLAVTSENVIRAYKDKIRGDFKGPPGMLADIEGPIREEASNTYWYKSKLLDYNGEQFSDAATAAGRAESIGLANPIIKGAEAGKLYIPETAAKKLESVTTTPAGRTRFAIDNDIEVESSPRPQPGYVPYNLKTGKFEKTLTEETARIEQQGLGFHIEVWHPMKETDNILRNLMIKTTGGETVPEAASSSFGKRKIINSLLGWVRNSDDTLAKNESAQRKAVAYTQSNIQQWAKDLNKDLEDIKNGINRYDPVTGEPISPFVSHPKSWLGKVIPGNKVAEEFNRTLEASRTIPDPATGDPGYFFKTGSELQDFYRRNFNRDPSFLETKAYFNYVKVKEGERVMGEIAEFRNRAREGYAQHQISVLDDAGKEIKSGFFDGRTLKQFPGGDDYVLIMGDRMGGESLSKLGHINDSLLKQLKEHVKDGRGKVIELYDIDHHPLNGFGDVAKDQRIRYVFTHSAEEKPLEFNHVNRKGGAHFEYDSEQWLKQADVRAQRAYKTDSPDRSSFEHIYVGDTTVMPIKNRRMGMDVAKIWNTAQEYAKQGHWDQAKPLIAKLGIEWKEWTGWYHPGRDEKGNVIRPRLSFNEPITVVHKDKNINQIDSALQERYPKTFKDGTKTGSANNFKVAYNTERRSFDMKTINDVGTQGNPIYAHQPAEFVDPITTMNRSLNRAINSTFMDDYKLHGVEHWLREAEPFLKASKEEIRSSPFWHFNNPEFRADVNLDQKLNLLSNRYKIRQFIGIPSKFDSWVHTFTEHLADNAYGKFGPEEGRNILQKARTIPPIWVLQHLTNPVDFIRGATFNYKLGFFNPAQFLVQAQTHSLIWALEPRHGTVGTYSMLLHGWSRVNKNPAILAALDNYATKLNMFGAKWRPGEWSEAMRELDRSGFEHVAGEYANLSKAYLPTTNFVQNDISKGLRLGQTPFRLGEQSTRVTAYYTAFSKFREANPTRPITNFERTQILNEADLLTVNMSRASSSMLNHGVFSLSTQFLSYQVKLAELFWSKRIGETATQRALARARLIGGFGALYGLSNAVGVTGAPVSDTIRSHVIDDFGYIPGEKWLSTMVNEGFPSWAIAMTTGNVENIGDRFGSQGWQNIKQGLRSDIPWWQAIGGAGVSTASNFVGAALDPFTQYALSWARGDKEGFTIRAADLVEPFKEIRTVSQGAKWWTAMQTGKWLSKNESYVTDVSGLRATMLATLGLNPQEQDDMFLTNQITKGETEAQNAALKEFIKDWRRGILAKGDNDDEQGNAYHRNAMARLTAVGYPPEKILSAIAIANKGYEKAIDAANERMWKNGDVNKQEQRLEKYKRQLQLNDQKAQ